MYILYARVIIMSTPRASSVFLSSYRNMVLNQSACVFALGYFLITYVHVCVTTSSSEEVVSGTLHKKRVLHVD